MYIKHKRDNGNAHTLFYAWYTYKQDNIEHKNSIEYCTWQNIGGAKYLLIPNFWQ